MPVCYDTDVQPILTNKCTMSGCHNSTDKAGKLDLSSYSAFQSSKEKDEILEAINEGKMPPSGYPPLTKEEKQILARWAGQNYSRGDCTINQNTSCDTTNVTYTNTIKAIFDNNCIGCHNAYSPAGGYALDSYMGSKICAQSGRLMGSIQWLSGYSPMPKGGNKLSDCNIKKIQKWINAGMPN
ncbi:MAG: hypothetical protein D6799_07825 [Bacteroidetes bacterium]|nr:MAG: hypothetical protein D6799_07825 [Bacteroidota bacterium]